MDETQMAFLQGLAAAIGILSRSYDEPSMAKGIAIECNYTLKDFEKANIDDFDMKEVRKVLK